MDKGNKGQQATERTGRATVSDTDDRSVDEALGKSVELLLSCHSYISGVDAERHGKKFNALSSNAISMLATSIEELEKYLKDRKKRGVYGTEKS